MEHNASVLVDLLAALTETSSEFVVVGGLAAGYHGRLRATIDVDLLVPKRKLKPLAAAMRRRGYETKAFPDMVRVYRGTPESVADLVARESSPTLKEAARHVETVTLLGKRVPMVTPGAFVALKFHAAVSPTRQLGDKYQDIVDVERVVTRKLAPDQRALALTIAERMYPGAPEDLARMLDDLAAGRPVKL
jgi:hypothetical protein